MWDTGYNATITITNTSDSVRENWCLTFPLNETMSNIWNATISKEHEDYDEDGLSILEEYNQGTDPLNPDTDEYVTLGNTGVDLEFPLFCASELFDWDSAGNYFNREFAIEIRDGSKNNQVYCDNKAYSIDISEQQKIEMIKAHVETNYYDLIENNCTRVAQYA